MLQNGKHDSASTHHVPHADEKTDFSPDSKSQFKVMDYNKFMD